MSGSSQQPPLSDSRLIVLLLGLISLMGIGVILYLARTIVLPFALAVFISFIMHPIITFFEKRRVPAALAILLALLLTFAGLLLLGIAINVSIQSFAEEFPKYEAIYEKRFASLVSSVLTFLELPPDFFSSQIPQLDRIQMLSAMESFSLGDLITTTLSSITRFLSNTFLVLLFLLFILMGRNQLTRKMSRAFEDHQLSERMVGMITNINQQIQKYIVTKTLISGVTAVVSTIIMVSFGVEFAYIWGILTFFLNFIPTVGSFLSVIMPLGVALLQYETYLTPMLVLLLLGTVQFTMGNFIDPRMVGRSVNLSPLVVLFSLLFWGWLWGIVGMFLAIPLSVIIKIIFENVQSLRFVSTLMSDYR